MEKNDQLGSGVYYSEWAYSAVRQATAIKGLSSVDELAHYLGLPHSKIQKVVQFLLDTKLCHLSAEGLKTGTTSTFLSPDSPWIRSHHLGWRMKAVEALDYPSPANLHFTSPLTLATADVSLVREKILHFIEVLNEIVDPSPSESLHCLNIDWFGLMSDR